MGFSRSAKRGPPQRAASTALRPAPSLQAKTAARDAAARQAVQLARQVQPALKVGAASDPLEVEADRTADRVMSMAAPAPISMTRSQQSGAASKAPQDAARATAGVGEQITTLRRAEDGSDQPNLDSLQVPAVPADHQDFELPSDENVGVDSLSVQDMAELESGEPADPAKAAGTDAASDPDGSSSAGESAQGSAAEGDVGAPPSDEAAAQRNAASDPGAAVGAEGGDAPADVAAAVFAPGPGRPLPEGLRAFVEPRFGLDFSDVRVHDSAADQAHADKIGARAFTHGRNIWIGRGESADNKRLMAHELTHVVQQTGRRHRARMPSYISDGPKTEGASTARPSAGAGLSPVRREPVIRRGWVAEKIEGIARQIPGYTLLTVLLEKSPITGERVARSATSLIGGLMGLIPGGTALYDKLQQTKAIDRAYSWITGELGRLDLSWSRIRRVIDDARARFSVTSPLESIRPAFAPLFRDITDFAVRVGQKVLEFIVRGALALAGPLADRVWTVLQRAGTSLTLILADPLGFALNLVRAVLKGFRQFSGKIFEYLKKGLLGWLFGTLQGAGITLPDKLDFKGIVSVVLQVLGLTYANFRAILVRKLGRGGERKVAFIEKSVEFVKLFLQKGFVGIWEKIVGMIEGLKETVIGGIRDFVIGQIIQGGLSWLAGLSNPAGAIIRVVLAIYNMITTFLERMGQIMQVAQSLFESMTAIALGQIQNAANNVEQAIARSIPVVISFLAALVPVTGITAKIQSLIKRIQAPVLRMMNKLVGFVVKKAKKLMARLIAKLNRKRAKPGVPFKVGAKAHRIEAVAGKAGLALKIRSEPKTYEETIAALKAERDGVEDRQALDILNQLIASLEQMAPPSNKAAARVKNNSKSQNQAGNMAALQSKLEQDAKEIQARTADLVLQASFDENGKHTLVRFIGMTNKMEGDVDLYSALAKRRAQIPVEEGLPKPSDQIELDHVANVAAMQRVHEFLNGKQSTRKNAPKIWAARLGKQVRITDEVKENAGRTDVFAALRATEPEKNIKLFPAIALDAIRHQQKASNAPDLAALDTVIGNNRKPRAEQVSEIYTLLNQHIDDEASRISTSYDTESNTTIQNRVKASLPALKNLARNKLGLNGSAPASTVENSAQSSEQSPERTFLMARGDAYHESGQKKVPQIADFEGTYGPYSRMSRNYSFTGILEADHIIEKAFPNAIKKKYPLAEALGEVDVTPSGGNEPTAAQARKIKRRKNKLMHTQAVGNQPVAGYDQAKVDTVLIFSGIHAKATAQASVKSGAKFKDEVAANGSHIEAARRAAISFVRDGQGKIEDVQNHVASAAKQKMMALFAEHKGHVLSGYANQVQYVQDINPGRTQDVTVAMTSIIARLGKAMDRLRAQTLGLFNV